MRRCLELAHSARAAGESPVGAVIVYGGEIIAEAAEQVRSGLDISGHAELIALRRACQSLGTMDLRECVLCTNVEPCWMCAFAIRETGIRSVVIGLPVPNIGGATSRHPILCDSEIAGWGPPPSLVWGVLAEECAAAVKEGGVQQR